MIVSTKDFRDNLAGYINDIYADKTPLVVGRFNKPLVVVRPFEDTEDSEDFMRFYGFLGNGSDGEKFLSEVRRSKKEKTRTENLRNRNV